MCIRDRRVGDEAVSVLNIINFYLPSAYVKTIQNVSNGLKLALDLIRKYLPELSLIHIFLPFFTTLLSRSNFTPR